MWRAATTTVRDLTHISAFARALANHNPLPAVPGREAAAGFDRPAPHTSPLFTTIRKIRVLAGRFGKFSLSFHPLRRPHCCMLSAARAM